MSTWEPLERTAKNNCPVGVRRRPLWWLGDYRRPLTEVDRMNRQSAKRFPVDANLRCD